MIKQHAFNLLRAKGATKAVVHYSGGNDEGGVDSITLYFAPTAAGEDVTADLPVYNGYSTYEWDEATKTHREVPPAPKTPDDELAELLCAPIEAQYGSWAGEFEAYGTHTWDVTTGDVIVSEEYQTRQFEHREERY